jgi:hypothetical protein
MIFWRWWTLVVLVATAMVSAEVYLGVVDFVVTNDPTYISFGIFALFVISSFVIGSWCFQLQRGTTIDKSSLGPLWFTSDALMSIGMIGTLLGFLMVLTSAFADVDTSDVEAMQEVIGQLATGMGTALLTSLVGLISSTLLKVQLVMLDTANSLGNRDETL